MAMVLMTASVASGAATINVDFNQDFLSSTFPTYSGAAVLGGSGDTWNAVIGTYSAPSVSNIALNDSTGSATGVTLSIPALGYINAAATSTPPIYSGSEAALMHDYVFAGAGQTRTLTLSGLASGGDYRLVLYSSSNVAGRQTEFSVNGVSESVLQLAANTLIEGVNYADFSTTASLSGDLSFSFLGIGSEGNLNGFQIQAIASVPVLASLASLATGLTALFGLGVARRKRMRLA